MYTYMAIEIIIIRTMSTESTKSTITIRLEHVQLMYPVHDTHENYDSIIMTNTISKNQTTK